MQEDDHSEDPDIEVWARQLAGKADGDVPAEVKALRNAIAASNESDRNAVALDRLSHARLNKRLEAAGLLDQSPTSARQPAAESRAARSRYSWQAWAGAAAAVLIAVVGVRLALPPTTVYRGFIGDITISSPQPEVELMSVTRQLEALGLKPRRVTEDGRALLEVDVAEQQLEVFYQWAQRRGGRPVAPGKYRIVIEAVSPGP